MIFRRYFRGSSLPAFYKKGVLKTSAKLLGKRICWSLFSINLQTFSQKFYWVKDCTDIFQWILQTFYFKNTFFLQDTSGQLLLMIFKLLIPNKFVHLINIVGTLYLMSRKRRFCFLWSIIKLEKHKLLLMFWGFPVYTWVIIRTIFSLKNLCCGPTGNLIATKHEKTVTALVKRYF